MNDSTTAELPVVDSEQVEEIDFSDQLETHHSQWVTINVAPEKIICVTWDSKILRLLEPAGYNAEHSIIAYRVIGHLEVDLPFPLDINTFSRQAMLLYNSYLAMEEAKEASSEQDISDEEE